MQAKNLSLFKKIWSHNLSNCFYFLLPEAFHHSFMFQLTLPVWHQQSNRVGFFKSICCLLGEWSFTLISLVSISPSEASSWWVSMYFSHLASAFSFATATVMAWGTCGCMTVSVCTLEAGLWSTHLSPAERDRLWRGRIGGAFWSGWRRNGERSITQN